MVAATTGHDDATPIGELYITTQREMDAKFENVVIMMAIGKFYEIYTFETRDGDVGRAKDVSRVCNIILTKKNKNMPSSMSNPHMCGFPVHSLSRYVTHLIRNGYTVAVYDQKPLEKGKITRFLQGVYSPCVSLDVEDADGMEDAGGENHDRGLMAVSCEAFEDDLQNRSATAVSMVYVNTSNGSVLCDDQSFHEKQDVFSWLLKIRDLHKPQEVLWKGPDVFTDVFSNTMVHKMPENWAGDNRKYKEHEFQEQFLQKVYPDCNKDGGVLISAVERAGLERHPDLVPLFVCTLEYLHDHHPLTVHRLLPPSFDNNTNDVFYNPSSLYDLNMISKDKETSILSLLDHTSTPMGKRLLRKQVFTPVFDTTILNQRYDEIDSFMKMKDRIDMNKVSFHGLDAEHVMRRLQIGVVGVQRLFRFLRFLLDVRDMRDHVPNHLPMSQEWMMHDKSIDSWAAFVKDTWDLALMQSWRNWEDDGVWSSSPPELVEMETKLQHHESQIRQWIEKTFGEDLRSKLVLAEEEAYLLLTKKKYLELKDKHTDARFRAMSSSHRLHHPRLDGHYHDRKRLMTEIVKRRRQLFQDQVMDMMSHYHDEMVMLVRMSARMDVILSHVRNVETHRLSRPIPDTDTGSMVVHGLRHLLVEANPSIRYVSNDLCLGEHEGHGILLFGQNSAGKSTLMKSLGVAVMMAQSGMFAPCTRMMWRPVRSFFTKIGSRDNIWKGRSTFITEMSELRHILERSDDRSLILCDELTSGTETFSATGIVASTLSQLLSQKSHFIMTTHLHTLKQFPKLMEDRRLRVMHLSMEYDAKTKNIYFDRILRDGYGKSIYGLEIAEYLGFSPEFLKNAYAYRSQLDRDDDRSAPKKRSRYNSKKWVDKCEKCGSTEELHTHHIEPQVLADEDGFIGNHHKNRLSNLMVLCRECHEHEHH